VQTLSNRDLAVGKLSARISGVGVGTGILNLSYGWDTNGNLTGRSDGNSSSLAETFSYDTLDRISSSTVTSNTYGIVPLTMSIAAGGNITSKSDISGSYTYGSGAGPDAMTGVTMYGIAMTGSYDANGNMKGLTGGGYTYAMTWSPKNQLTAMSVSYTGGSQGENFTYGPDGDRLIRATLVNGSTTKTTSTLGDGLEEVATAGSSTSTKNYLVTPTGVIGAITQSSGQSDSISYFHSDNLGSVAAISNSSGSLVQRMYYDIYGQRWSTAGASSPATSWGYTGQLDVDDLSVVHMNGRVYWPALGRFLSPDPIVQAPENLQSYNRYAYVFNSPLNYVDPSGFEGGCVSTASVGGHGGREAQGPPLPSCGGEGANITQEPMPPSDQPLPPSEPPPPPPPSSGGYYPPVGGSNPLNGDTGSSGTFNVGTSPNPGPSISANSISGATGNSSTQTGTSTGSNVRGVVSNTKSASGGQKAGPSTSSILGAPASESPTLRQRLADTLEDVADWLENRGNELVPMDGIGFPIEWGGIGIGRAAASLGLCFVGGTPIQTPNGPKPIEDIRPGDLVYAVNPVTQVVEIRSVLQLFRNSDQLVLFVEITTEDGKSEKIGATLQHPFWVVDRGWVTADQLAPGDLLIEENGGRQRVVSILNRGDRADTFNFEVDGDHSYFVGRDGVLVHNASTGGLGNIGSHLLQLDPTNVLGSAVKWLDAGYKEIAPGVYRSADGLRQFRMTASDIAGAHGSIGPHVHFEALDASGNVVENLHLPVAP